MFRYFICAVQFLTTLPIRGNAIRDQKDLARSMAFYPLVGLFIGMITVLSYQWSNKIFTGGVSVVIAFIVGILITGGLHLDGFADLCDGFYAGKNQNEILTIMKDTHIGTMAVIGLFSLLTLKLSLYYSIFTNGSFKECILSAPAGSRWMMTVIATMHPYARNEGTAKLFVEHVTWREAVVSTFIVILIFMSMTGINGMLVLMATFAIVYGFTQWVKNRLQGITGDVLGAVNEISEITILLLLHINYFKDKQVWIL